MWRYLVPLGIFIVLVVFLSIGLKLDPRDVPSPLIGKAAPAFTLPKLQHPEQTVSPADYKGRVWLLNVWASWCVSCRAEHPVINQLAQSSEVPIIGLNYKDGRDVAMQWLQQRGDPYTASAFDEDGRVGIDWGVYGVPETFIIDKKGTIRYKHTGPVDQKAVIEKIMPVVRELEKEPA
ncbi:MAG: DsbE family thiol:disulfide interchange protein [Thiohalomonadales bacterium]|nr:DsbE family thiol:disulfide interchange protein [Thiohalomonadales bacterium]